MITFEEDIPPPVTAWFMDVHRRAQGVLPNDVTVTFRIENVNYNVVISRRVADKKAANV